MRARKTQVRGVPPAIVAPVGGANPGDGCNSPSLPSTTGPRPSPCPPTGPGRIGGGGVPLRRPRTFLRVMIPKSGYGFSEKIMIQNKDIRRQQEGPMSPDNSLDFAAIRVQHTPMRLLIIEDDHAAADYLVKAFREVGHVADTCPDGEDGLALALEGGHDVLIVDRMLPR